MHKFGYFIGYPIVVGVLWGTVFNDISDSTSEVDKAMWFFKCGVRIFVFRFLPVFNHSNTISNRGSTSRKSLGNFRHNTSIGS